MSPPACGKSLYGLLLIIFLAATVAVVVIAGFTLNRVLTSHPRNLVAEQLLAHVLAPLEPEPEPHALQQLAQRLGWDLVVGGPAFTWSSVPEAVALARLDTVAPRENFAFFWQDGQRWLVYRKDAWRYYIHGFKQSFSAGTKAVMLAGSLGLLLVLYLAYRAVLRLLAPLRILHAGADRIAAGDLDFRVATSRRDELGELTRSVNNMADRLQSALEAKHQLLLAMGHELRTPLARARLLLEMLPEGADRDQLGRNLSEMSELVVALLEAEALSGGHIPLQREPVDIGDLLQRCVEQVGCAARVELPEALPPIMADGFRLGIAVRNLLSNAAKYGGGDIVLRVGLHNGILSLVVADNGEGLDPETLERLGQAFYRPDSSRSRKTGGHGLGLYLCRVIVESHGGKLLLRSEPGQGTEAEIRLSLSL